MGLARSARQESPAAVLSCLDVSAIGASAELLLPAARSALDGGQEPSTCRSRVAFAVYRASRRRRRRWAARSSCTSTRAAPSRTCAWCPAAGSTTTPVRGEARLRVRAVGLNFRDVLNVLGAYPGDPGPPGGDCAAVVSAVGSGISHLNVGDAALGHGLAALASLSRSDGRLLAAIDKSLSFEQACTLPTTWCTVHMSLLAARPAAGHDVLLHAGAGGVGLAARSTRTGSAPAHGERRPAVQALLPASHGPRRPHAQLARRRRLRARRVEAARRGRLRFSLNSLSADFIACSFALLRQDGWLCEIGKRAVWSYERLESASLRATWRSRSTRPSSRRQIG